MNSESLSYSPLMLPSPNPLLNESFYNKVPHPQPKKGKRIPSPIVLNKPNEKNIDPISFSLKQADDLFILGAFEDDKKDNSFALSLSSASETEDEVNELPENVNQYRRMLKRCKSKTVKEHSFDTEVLITNERIAREYQGLASKTLIPYKKNSCVDPSVKNKLEEVSEKEDKKDYEFYQKRCPRMKRGYSILDILELTCGDCDNLQ